MSTGKKKPLLDLSDGASSNRFSAQKAVEVVSQFLGGSIACFGIFAEAFEANGFQIFLDLLIQ